MSKTDWVATIQSGGYQLDDEFERLPNMFSFGSPDFPQCTCAFNDYIDPNGRADITVTLETAPGYLDTMQSTTVVTNVVRDLDGKVVTSNKVGDGCRGQPMAALFGSAQAFVIFFTQLNQLEMVTGEAWRALHKDPDYLARNRPWAECMKSAGFTYQTIFEPQNRDWNSPRPTPEEQQVAAADSRCRHGNHLDGADLLILEQHTLGDLLAEHPIGNYDEFELQARALTAGKFPTADNRTAPPASTG